MRWMWGVVLAFVAASAFAQNESPLVRGRLVLWVVRPAAKGWNPELARMDPSLGPAGIPKTVQEQTAGSFGTASSNVGTAASEYGQTASTLGQTAGSYGHAASEHGQAAGSYGTASSNVGQTAGSYGQTSSSYSGPDSGGTVDRRNLDRWLTPVRAPLWSQLRDSLRHDFPGLQAVMYEIREEDLQAGILAAAGRPEAADVLLGAPLPTRWATANHGALLQTIVQAKTETFFPAYLPSYKVSAWGHTCLEPEQRYAVMVNAANPDGARAFSAWFSAAYACETNLVDKDRPLNEAETIAVHAAGALVTGGSFGAEFDKDAVKIAPGIFSAWNVEMHQAVLSSHGDALFRAVGVRSIVADKQVARVIRTLVVLRRGSSEEPWRILQITLDMTLPMLMDSVNMLGSAVMGKPSGQALTAVSLAAPRDGEARMPTPDLWWDNKGGAKLEVVEWMPSGIAPSRLFLVQDTDGVAKTRVGAAFATFAGEVKWRVWSVGSGGAVAMTGWRGMVITP